MKLYVTLRIQRPIARTKICIGGCEGSLEMCVFREHINIGFLGRGGALNRNVIFENSTEFILIRSKTSIKCLCRVKVFTEKRNTNLQRGTFYVLEDIWLEVTENPCLSDLRKGNLLARAKAKPGTSWLWVYLNPGTMPLLLLSSSAKCSLTSHSGRCPPQGDLPVSALHPPGLMSALQKQLTSRKGSGLVLIGSDCSHMPFLSQSLWPEACDI